MLVYSASRSRKSSPSLPSRSCRHTDTQQRQGTACRHSSQPGRGGQRATRHTNPADQTFDDSTLLLTRPPCSTSEAHQLQRRHLGLHLLLSQRLPTLSGDGDSSRQLQGACGVQWVGGTAQGAQVCNSRAGRCTVPSRRGPVSGGCTAGETWRRYFNPFEGTAACALSPWAAMLLHRTTPYSLTHIVLPDVAAALNTATTHRLCGHLSLPALRGSPLTHPHSPRRRRCQTAPQRGRQGPSAARRPAPRRPAGHRWRACRGPTAPAATQEQQAAQCS